MASWYNIQEDFHREHDNWWKKLVKGLNNAFNPNHAWFDYDKWERNGTTVDNMLNAVGQAAGELLDPTAISSIVNKYTGAHLTGAEQEANEFSAGEAQKSRDFTEYMARNKYAMETESMQNAGVNPAMVYGGGNLVSTASNGASASSVSPTTGDLGNLIFSIIRMPLEMKRLEQDINESKSRERKNEVEAHGVDLQNNLTETTWNDLIAKAGLDNDAIRAEIDLKKKQATTEVEKAKLTAAETLLTKMDKSQKEELFPLLKHAQELSNAYQETTNAWQERQIRMQLRESSARIKNLVASALLSDEQRKYAGRMTLGQALAMAIGNEGGLGKVVEQIMSHSPLGGLIDILQSWLDSDLDDRTLGKGGETSGPQPSRPAGTVPYGTGNPTVGSR